MIFAQLSENSGGIMKQSTREQIIWGAIKVLRHNPEASIEEIANQISLTRMTIYRYFKKREFLIQAIFLVGHSIFIREFDAAYKTDLPVLEKLKKFLTGLMPEWDNFYFLNYEPFYTVAPVISQVNETEKSCFRQIAEHLREAGCMSKEQPLEWSRTVLSSTFDAACDFYCEERYSAEETAKFFIDTICTAKIPGSLAS